MAWLPPLGNSRQAPGLNHSWNIKATSAAMVPSAGNPESKKLRRFLQGNALVLCVNNESVYIGLQSFKVLMCRALERGLFRNEYRFEGLVEDRTYSCEQIRQVLRSCQEPAITASMGV